jgi:lipopolysaccharide/colanic/teichoic acid biosynthesis glycosyltransferase
MIAASESGSRGVPKAPVRCAAILGYDAFATLCGAYGALLLCLSSGIRAELATEVRRAVPLLLFLRLTTVMAARLHSWSRASGYLGSARLALFMFVATLVFAVGFRGLPMSFYVLEYFITASLMTALRCAPGVAGDFFRSRFSRAKARFLSAELPRRVLNVAVASVALVLTLPLWILIAAAVKLTSRGPVFYKQERIGLDLRSHGPVRNDSRRKRDLGGRPFMMYKFRTMRVDAEASTGAVWSPKNDARVTPVGRFLRHSRLDELPQLINVLKGDMNVVGPRPERPGIFAELRERIPDYQRRQRVRPGITGHAQVNQEYDSSIDDVANKVKYDLEYLTQQSVTADLCIMAKTLPVMLLRDKMLAPKAPPDLESPLPASPAKRRGHGREQGGAAGTREPRAGMVCVCNEVADSHVSEPRSS